MDIVQRLTVELYSRQNKVEFIGVNQRFFEELQAIAEDKVYYQPSYGETVGKLITFMGIPIKIIEDLPYSNVVFGEVVQ